MRPTTRRPDSDGDDDEYVEPPAPRRVATKNAGGGKMPRSVAGKGGNKMPRAPQGKVPQPPSKKRRQDDSRASSGLSGVSEGNSSMPDLPEDFEFEEEDEESEAVGARARAQLFASAAPSARASAAERLGH